MWPLCALIAFSMVVRDIIIVLNMLFNANSIQLKLWTCFKSGKGVFKICILQTVSNLDCSHHFWSTQLSPSKVEYFVPAPVQCNDEHSPLWGFVGATWPSELLILVPAAGGIMLVKRAPIHLKLRSSECRQCRLPCTVPLWPLWQTIRRIWIDWQYLLWPCPEKQKVLALLVFFILMLVGYPSILFLWAWFIVSWHDRVAGVDKIRFE